MMIERFISTDFLRLAGQYPVITLTGPRQSGKTTLCKSLFDQCQYANLEDLEMRSFAEEDPKGFLAQFANCVILDEIQRAPKLVSYIQTIVDVTKKAGQFILTGSQQFEVTDTINQSLAGRTAILRLLPFAYGEIYEKSSPSLSNIIYKGFYPRIHDKKLVPTEALSFYLSTYIERDLRSLIQIKDLSAFERFLKICATQIGQLINYSKLANDCGVAQSTIKAWLSILKASYIIFELQPHFENFRKRLVKSSKLYFYDVGLASYLLGINKPEHFDTHPLKGALFENFVVAEFIKNRFNHVKDGNLYFYRDHVGNEVDLILDYGQELISVEIKLSQSISGHSLKGLQYYHSLASEKNSKRYVIYTGNQEMIRNEINIIPYTQFQKLFNSLPN